MLAYSRTYDAKRLILVYPWHREMDMDQGVVRRWSVTRSDCLPDVAAVDVGRPDGIGGILREICEWEPGHHSSAAANSRTSLNCGE